MTKKELQELRAEKVKAMETVVETRDKDMDEESLAVVKSFKDEIAGIDRQIEAIDELRAAAEIKSNPTKSEKNIQMELRSAMTDYLQGNIDYRTWEKRANSVGSNGDLVPEEFYNQLLKTLVDYGAIYGDANIITTSGNGELSIPTFNDTQAAASWINELGMIAQEDFTTGTIVMNAYKVATGIQMSTEILEDSAFDLISYVATALGERISRAIESAFIKGDGNGKPTGILEDTKTVVETSANVGVVSSDDLLGLIHNIPASQRKGGVFYVSDEAMGALLLEKDADGRPLLQPSAQATPGSDMMYSIGGYPLKTNFELESVATGNVVAIFGNPKSYSIRVVRNVTLKRDDYSSMDVDAVNLYTTMRIDGKVVNPNTCFTALEIA